MGEWECVWTKSFHSLLCWELKFLSLHCRFSCNIQHSWFCCVSYRIKHLEMLRNFVCRTASHEIPGISVLRSIRVFFFYVPWEDQTGLVVQSGDSLRGCGSASCSKWKAKVLNIVQNSKCEIILCTYTRNMTINVSKLLPFVEHTAQNLMIELSNIYFPSKIGKPPWTQMCKKSRKNW